MKHFSRSTNGLQQTGKDLVQLLEHLTVICKKRKLELKDEADASSYLDEVASSGRHAYWRRYTAAQRLCGQL